MSLNQVLDANLLALRISQSQEDQFGPLIKEMKMKIYSTCEKMNINAYFINDSCGFEYNWLGLVMAVDKSYSDLDTLSRVIDSYLVEIKPIQHPAKENAVTLYNRGLD